MPTLTTDDGTTLYYKYSKQKSSAELIFIAHGLAEHSGRYEHVVNWFYQHGYHVAIMDFRGHGKSSGVRGYIDSFDQYTNDLDCVLKKTQQLLAPTATHVVAHSMGGTIATHYILKQKDKLPINNVILSSPFLGIPKKARPPKFVVKLLSLLAKHYKYLAIPGTIKSSLLSHDDTFNQAYDNDPLIFHALRVKWYLHTVATFDKIFENINAWPQEISLLLLIAGQDQIVDIKSEQRFFESLASPNKEILQYDNLYHELFHEPNHLEILNDILNWLRTNENNLI